MAINLPPIPRREFDAWEADEEERRRQATQAAATAAPPESVVPEPPAPEASAQSAPTLPGDVQWQPLAGPSTAGSPAAEPATAGPPEAATAPGLPPDVQWQPLPTPAPSATEPASLGTSPPSPDAPSRAGLQPAPEAGASARRLPLELQNQFGDPQLSYEEALAACGPAAAVSFARATGRNPTLAEARDLARQVGWTPQRGMAGPQSQVQLLQQMGVAARLETGTNWDRIRQELDSGNPVLLDSPDHYYTVSGYDPDSNRYYVGPTGTAYKGGAEWMTPTQMSRLSGDLRATLYLDSPTTPNPSPNANPPAAQAVTPTTVDLAGGAAVRGNAPEGQRDRLLSYGAQAALQRGLGEEGARAVQAILVTEGGLEGAIGDRDQSRVGSHGPLQFYGGPPDRPGQLNSFARAHGMSLEDAGAYVRTNPEAAIDWALDGYLGSAVRRGLEQGKSGPDLATYAQQTGQVSKSPERAGANWNALFGNGQPLKVVTQPSPTPSTGSGVTSSTTLPTIPVAELGPEFESYLKSRGSTLESRYGALLGTQPPVPTPPARRDASAAQAAYDAQWANLPAPPPPAAPAPVSTAPIVVGEPRRRPEPAPPAPEPEPYGPPVPEGWEPLDPTPAPPPTAPYGPPNIFATGDADRGIGMEPPVYGPPVPAGFTPPPPPAPSFADRVGGAVRTAVDATPVGSVVNNLERGTEGLRAVTPASIVTRSLAGEEQIANETRPLFEALQNAIETFGPDSPEAQAAANAYNAATGRLRAEGVYAAAERHPAMTGDYLPESVTSIPLVGGIARAAANPENVTGLAASLAAGAVAPTLASGVGRNIAAGLLDPSQVAGNVAGRAMEAGSEAYGAIRAAEAAQRVPATSAGGFTRTAWEEAQAAEEAARNAAAEAERARVAAEEAGRRARQWGPPRLNLERVETLPPSSAIAPEQLPGQTAGDRRFVEGAPTRAALQEPRPANLNQPVPMPAAEGFVPDVITPESTVRPALRAGNPVADDLERRAEEAWRLGQEDKAANYRKAARELRADVPAEGAISNVPDATPEVAISHPGSSIAPETPRAPERAPGSLLTREEARPEFGGTQLRPGFEVPSTAQTEDVFAPAREAAQQADAALSESQRMRNAGMPELFDPTPANGAAGPRPTELPRTQAEVVRVPVADIHVDPERFQFKSDVNPTTGASSKLKDARFNDRLASTLYGWEDRSGNLYVVNGHHRLDLARRSGADSVHMIVDREADGVTPSMARAHGALLNISEDQGTPLDVAKFLRETGAPVDTLIENGVSPTGRLASRGVALADLDESVFRQVVRGDLPEDVGAMIGAGLRDNPAAQRDAATLAGQGKLSEREVRALIAEAQGAENVSVSQATLFGETAEERSTLIARAKLRSYVEQEIAKDKRNFGFVANEERAAELARGRNKIDVAESARLAQESAAAGDVFNRLASLQGPVAQAIGDGAAEAVRSHKGNIRGVQKATLERVREAIRGELAGDRGGAAAAELGAEGGGRAARAPRLAAPAPTGRPQPPAAAAPESAGAVGGAVGRADEGVTELFSGVPFVRSAPRVEPLRPPVGPRTEGDDALDRLGAKPAKTTIDPRTWPARAERFLHEKLVNDRVDLERMQEQVAAAARARGMDGLPPEFQAAALDRLTGGSFGTARIRVQDELETAYRAAGPHVEALKKYLEAHDNLDKAARIGRRAGAEAQANRQFSGGVTEEKTRKALARLRDRYSDAEWAQIEDAAQGVYRYVDGLRERLVTAGVWDRAFADELKQEMPHYIPTRIVDHMGDPSFLPSARRISLRDDGVHRLTTPGTEKEREDVTASLVRLAFETERRAAKNETAQAVYSWRDLDPALAELMREVRPGTKLDKHEVAVRFFVNGEAREVAIDKSLEPAVSFATPKHVLSFPIGGGKEFAPFEAAANLTRITATERNPAFALAGNPLLDLPSYLYSQTSQYGLLRTPQIVAELGKALVDSFSGFTRNQFTGEGTRRFLKGGGGQFGFFSGGLADTARLAREVEHSGGYLMRTPQDVARFLWDLTPALGTRIENAPRIAAMRNAERYGADAQRAILAGREATVDFSRGGQWTKIANQVVPFFNVATQTVPWTARLIQRNPKGAIASLTAGAVLPTVVAEAWNRSDPARSEAYDDVPDYVKQQGIVLMLPDEGTDEQGRAKHRYGLLPMRNFGAVVLPTRAAMERVMSDAQPTEWQEVLSQVVSGSTPVQTDSPVQALGGFVPAVFGTALQLAVGKDFFRDRYIVSDTTNERATALSRGIAERTGAEPAQVEFAIRDTANGVGGILLAAVDLAAKAARGEPLTPENPAPGERPFAGGVVGRFVRHQGGQVDQDLRELREATAKEYARQFKDALAESPDAPATPVELDQARERLTRLANELATISVYGTKAKPETIINRVRDDPAFSSLSRTEQATTLAELRQVLAEARKEDQPQRREEIRATAGQVTEGLRGG